MSTGTSCSLANNMPLLDAIEFKKIIGTLQYLAFTRPDIAFPINKLIISIYAQANTKLLDCCKTSVTVFKKHYEFGLIFSLICTYLFHMPFLMLTKQEARIIGLVQVLMLFTLAVTQSFGVSRNNVL